MHSAKSKRSRGVNSTPSWSTPSKPPSPPVGSASAPSKFRFELARIAHGGLHLFRTSYFCARLFHSKSATERPEPEISRVFGSGVCAGVPWIWNAATVLAVSGVHGPVGVPMFPMLKAWLPLAVILLEV